MSENVQTDAARKEQNKARAKMWHSKNKKRSLDIKRAYHRNHREELIRKKRAARVKAPWKALISGARQRAKAKALPYDLSCDWAKARYTGRCELTGLPFRIGSRAGMVPFSPSLDRIDQARGYTQDNCRFILFGLNAFRGTGTDQEMYQIADALLEAAGRRAGEVGPLVPEFSARPATTLYKAAQHARADCFDL